MSRRTSVLTALLTLASACHHTAAPVQRAAAPSIRVETGDMRTFPPSDEARAKVGPELATFVETLYRRGFLPAAHPAPATSPAPAQPEQAELFTEAARTALARTPDVFRAGPTEHVSAGTVRFSGFATVDGPTELGAMLAVTFAARGLLVQNGTTQQLRLEQSGRIWCMHTDAGWRVAGFDLTIAGSHQVHGATAPPTAAAFGMPS